MSGDGLDDRLTDIESALKEVSCSLGTVEGTLEGQAESVDQRLRNLEDLTSRGHWNADDVPDDLDGFVAWLVTTYYLEPELLGWAENSAIRQELQALHIAWRKVAGPSAGPFDALAWHDHLARVVDRAGDHRRRRSQLLGRSRAMGS